MTNKRKSLAQGSSSKRKTPESSSGDSDFIPTPKRSRKLRVHVQSPNPESSSSSLPVGNPEKKKTREDGDAGFSETSIAVKPPAKRTRMSRSARASVAAAAQLNKGILGLAVELLCKICHDLRPFDLLNLSRVCTTFRSLLHGPSSTLIWRTVRIANKIPDFASKLNISEQRFADLAFGESCHVCGKVAKTGTAMKRRIIWALGLAVCEACNKKCLVNESDLGPNFPNRLLLMMPCTDTLIGRFDLRFLKNMAFDWLQTYNSQPGAEAKKRWLKIKDAEQRQLRENAVLGSKKYKEQQAKDRTDSVLTELRRRGWAQEIATIGSEWGDHTIEQTRKLRAKCQKELSATALEELIEHLVPMLEAERMKRLQKEREQMLKHRLKLLQELHKSCVSELPANTLLPSSADLFMYPVVRQLIEDSPNDGEFTLVYLTSIKKLFRETSKHWASETKAKLFAMMQGKTQPGGEELRNIDTVLNLATTFFICSYCCSHTYYRDREPSFRYKRTIMHACTRKCEYQEDLMEPFLSLYRFLGIVPWNHSEVISFDTDAHHFMREVVTMCGLDPDITTAKDMDTLNPIFECLKCNSAFRGRCTMTWESAVTHRGANGPHPVVYKPGNVAVNLNLVLLGESEAKLVQARMAEALARERVKHRYDGLCCSVCKVTGNYVLLADATHRCENTDAQTDRKLVPCLDHRQYAAEYWVWPPRDVARMEIGPALESDSEDGEYIDDET